MSDLRAGMNVTLSVMPIGGARYERRGRIVELFRESNSPEVRAIVRWDDGTQGEVRAHLLKEVR